PTARFPELNAGERATVRLDLTPLPAFAASVELARKLTTRAAFDAPELPAQAATLGQQMEARFVVLVMAATGKGGTLKAEDEVWDVATGARLRELKFDADAFSVDRAADTIKLWIERPSPVAVIEAKPGIGPVWQKPWFWGAAAVVVAGAAVGLAVGL